MKGEKQFVIPAGMGILDYLHSKDVFIPAPCGGQGTCGKCKIRLLAGMLPVSEGDRALLSEDELSAGFRLACRAKPLSPVRISVSIVSDYVICTDVASSEYAASFDYKADCRYGIAIDIGSTTLAASLVDMSEKRVLVTHTSLNRQSTFGADVMSRMESALSGRAEALKAVIERDLLDLIDSLDLPSEINLSDIVIAGNTAMYHFLLERDVSGLAKYPFVPVTLGGETFTRDEVFAYETQRRSILSPDCKIRLVPGLSAFVGGDITAGIFASGLLKVKENVFFIDIGTNAEMVLKVGDKLFTASAAAGPALEGGNLKWGTGSVPGAICGVEGCGYVHFDCSAKLSLLSEPESVGLSEACDSSSLSLLEREDSDRMSSLSLSERENSDRMSSLSLSKRAKSAEIKTIASAPPVGICGTGAIEAVYELLRAGIINEYGTFTEEYINNGFPLAKSAMGEIITLDQEDIRQIQMAKAAIRAGAEVLLRAAGVSAGEIDKVYVSGGFGTFLDIKKAVGIGLLPTGLWGKAETLGNTSLKGAELVLTEGLPVEWDDSREEIRLINLAQDSDFKELYIECMNFEIPHVQSPAAPSDRNDRTACNDRVEN